MTLLYCGRTVRSSHRRCTIKKLLLKISQSLQETPVLKSLFRKVAGLKVCNFIKKRPQRKCFLVNISKFLRLPILKNIFEWLIFYCFNGSVLHGPKGSRFRLYEDVKFQGLSHRSNFLFLSRHFSSLTEARPTLRRIHLMSQLSVYTDCFWSI